MEKLIISKELTYEMYALLNKLEDFFRDTHPHSQEHTEISDLLNEVDRQKESYSQY